MKSTILPESIHRQYFANHINSLKSLKARKIKLTRSLRGQFVKKIKNQVQAFQLLEENKSVAYSNQKIRQAIMKITNQKQIFPKLPHQRKEKTKVFDYIEIENKRLKKSIENLQNSLTHRTNHQSIKKSYQQYIQLYFNENTFQIFDQSLTKCFLKRRIKFPFIKIEIFYNKSRIQIQKIQIFKIIQQQIAIYQNYEIQKENMKIFIKTSSKHSRYLSRFISQKLQFQIVLQIIQERRIEQQDQSFTELHKNIIQPDLNILPKDFELLFKFALVKIIRLQLTQHILLTKDYQIAKYCLNFRIMNLEENLKNSVDTLKFAIIHQQLYHKTPKDQMKKTNNQSYDTKTIQFYDYHKLYYKYLYIYKKL